MDQKRTILGCKFLGGKLVSWKLKKKKKKLVYPFQILRLNTLLSLFMLVTSYLDVKSIKILWKQHEFFSMFYPYNTHERP